MSSFTTPLKIEFDHAGDEKKPYALLEEFLYYTKIDQPEGAERLIRIPAGYRTDFASIPRLFWPVLPPHGPYGKAAVVHDWLCDEQPHSVDHRTAADIFGEAMDVLHVSKWKRSVMVWSVKHFGPRFAPELLIHEIKETLQAMVEVEAGEVSEYTFG